MEESSEMKFNRGFWSGLAAVALVGGLLTPVVVAPTAQAAQTISGVTCTANFNGGDINADPGEVLTFSGDWTDCARITISSAIVDDSTAITAISGGSITVTEIPNFIILNSANFTGLQITLASQPVPKKAFAVYIQNTVSGSVFDSSWAVAVGSAPNPNPPAPTPAVPPSAPTSAVATTGNGEVTVSWQAPASSGSFPVTNYQVQSTPGSRGCVVPVTTTSCRIGGLTNGRAYTFQVRALNGGGWGSWATTSAVTPGPGPSPDASIMITGSRSGNDRVARVRGETTGLVGASVQSMVRMSDRVEFAAGSTRQVDAQGTFMWQRRINPQANLEVYFTAGELRSNAVTIPGGR
jgi:hypothetical protein